MNREKRAPLGTCDLCGGPIPPGEWYTCKGKPRLHCSLECRQTDNSRTGAPVRSAKAKQRVADGTWVNPFDRMTPAARAINSRPEKHGNNPTLHHAIVNEGNRATIDNLW